jgi:hypothetical protein
MTGLFGMNGDDLLLRDRRGMAWERVSLRPSGPDHPGVGVGCRQARQQGWIDRKWRKSCATLPNCCCP